MISKLALVAVLALVPLTGETQAAMAPSKLEVTLDASGAVATGVTRGGSVAWLGVSRTREDWSDHHYHWRLTTPDDDKDGVVRYPLEKGFRQMTILAAVDLTSGTWGVGATYPLGNDVPGPDLGETRSDAAGLVTAFARKASRVDILVVRPGTDAWSARILDGSALDADGTKDGVVTVSLAAMPARSGSAARLDGIRPGDIVAMADPNGPWVRIGRATAAGGKD